jgi:hypothetical protein
MAHEVAAEAASWRHELSQLRAENARLSAVLAASNVRIGFSYAKGLSGLLSRTIMMFTKAPCSHAWLVYWDQDFQRDMVMEAHTEWRLIPFADFAKQNHIVAVYEPKQSIDVGLRLGGRLLGSRYDVEGLLGNLVVIVGEWLKRKWRNPIRSRRMVFCSEGVARIMQAADYPGTPKDPNSVRPEHLLALLASDGSKEWKS